MKPWSAFFDYVAPRVPGATPELMELHIRNAAIEFCSETRAVTYDLQITTVVDQPEYDISLTGTGYAPILPDEVYYGSRELHEDTVDRLSKAVIGWREATGSPIVYICTDPYTIRFYPTPDEVIDIDVKLAVKPARDATGVADYVFDRYVEVIANGAVASIVSIPQKPYSNPTTAKLAAMEFSRGKASAKTEVYKSFTRAGTRVRLRKKF